MIENLYNEFGRKYYTNISLYTAVRAVTATHSVHIVPLNLTHGEAKSGHEMCLCPYIDSLLLKYCLGRYIKAVSFFFVVRKTFLFQC